MMTFIALYLLITSSDYNPKIKVMCNVRVGYVSDRSMWYLQGKFHSVLELVLYQHRQAR